MPVLLLTGTVGAGKTAVAEEIAEILKARQIPHAVLDLDWLGQVYPGDESDRYNQQLILKNLAAISPNFRAAGAERLILARVIEHGSEVADYERAVPGAEVKVVRIKASAETIRDRISTREGELSRERHLLRTVELDAILERNRPEDLLVLNEGKTVHEVALEVLGAIGWG